MRCSEDQPLHHGHDLGKHLIRVGLCPPNAMNVEMLIPATGMILLRYEVALDVTDLPKIAAALVATAAAAENP